MPTLVEPDVADVRDMLENLAPPCEAPDHPTCEVAATWIVWFHFCHLCRKRTCTGHLLCQGHKDNALARTLMCPRCSWALDVKKVEAI